MDLSLEEDPNLLVSVKCYILIPRLEPWDTNLLPNISLFICLFAFVGVTLLLIFENIYVT